MDSNTVLLIAVIGIVVVVLVGIWLFRRGTVETEIKGPGGTGATLKGSQPKAPEAPRAIETGDIKTGRDATLTDETGSGMKTGDIDAGQDATLTAKPKSSDDPKANPPT